MNSKGFQRDEERPVFRQHKTPRPRCYPASNEPYTQNTGPVYSHSRVSSHSEQRQTVSASARIDRDTDAYIGSRLASGKRLNKQLTRSKVIAEMLAERARDETFERSQSILVPIIQDTLRAEFRVFENRFLGIIARIAYQVSFLFLAFFKFLGVALRHDPILLHQIAQNLIELDRKSLIMAAYNADFSFSRKGPVGYLLR